MKCRYRFRAESDAKLNDSIEFAIGRRRYVFEAKDGHLAAISIEISGYPYHPPAERELIPGELPTLDLPLDRAVHIIVTREFHTLRGALAIWGVTEIDADYPEITWLPETVEEQRIEILSWNIQPTKPECTLPAPLDMLVRCVLAGDLFARYQIPFDFYRRGLADIRKETFIEAFYQFWFILEYLFGGGVYSKKGVSDQFRASSLLKEAVDRAKDELRAESDPALKRRLDTHYLTVDFEAVIARLIKLRGFLHHQSIARKATWNPAYQREFAGDTMFLMHVCSHVLSGLACPILFDSEQIAKFKKTPVRVVGSGIIHWTSDGPTGQT